MSTDVLKGDPGELARKAGRCAGFVASDDELARIRVRELERQVMNEATEAYRSAPDAPNLSALAREPVAKRKDLASLTQMSLVSLLTALQDELNDRKSWVGLTDYTAIARCDETIRGLANAIEASASVRG